MILRKCLKCRRYTMKERCPLCKSKTVTAHPPKFSLEWEKKFGKYRQRFKLKEIKSV